MKVLFIRSPRFLWPIINESDNFLMPLNYPCLAAMIREHMEGVEVKIIDCLPLKMGWKSLRQALIDEQPDVVGVGDEAIYHTEGMRVLSLAKETNPDCITVTGGHFFTHVPREGLRRFPQLDYIVRFEGEETMVDLLRTLADGGSLDKVKGIAFRRGDEVVLTPPRPLVEDLDSLPMPAYDLMPVEKYSPFGFLWRRAFPIEHSRGCIDRCSFCSLWPQMGTVKVNKRGEEVINPRFRTKSVARTIQEIETLYHKYGSRYLFWIDATFNADSEWTGELCDELMRRKLKLDWFAFVRADFLLRDEERGVLEKMVKAGLMYVLIGIERRDTAHLRQLCKSRYTRESTKEAYHLLRRKYPQVFRQGTFVTGIEGETRESMMDLLDYAIELGVDYPAFHPINPVPGTTLYKELTGAGKLEINDFSRCDWFTPLFPSDALSTSDIAELNKELNKRFILYRPQWAVKGLLSRSKLRRGLYQWFLYITARMAMREVADLIKGKKSFEGVSGFMKMRRPNWYDD